MARRGSPALARRVRDLSGGRCLAEPDLRIAAIVLSRDATLVTGNVRRFARVPDLSVEDWLTESA